MAGGEYTHWREEKGSDITTQLALASGATGSAAFITVRNATTSINVQRIRVVQTTLAAATSLTFRETDSTGAIIGVLYQTVSGPLTVGEQSYFLDFGPKGWKMTAGADLFLVRATATGPGANVVVEAYGTTSGPVAIATTN